MSASLIVQARSARLPIVLRRVSDDVICAVRFHDDIPSDHAEVTPLQGSNRHSHVGIFDSDLYEHLSWDSLLLQETRSTLKIKEVAIPTIRKLGRAVVGTPIPLLRGNSVNIVKLLEPSAPYCLVQELSGEVHPLWLNFCLEEAVNGNDSRTTVPLQPPSASSVPLIVPPTAEPKHRYCIPPAMLFNFTSWPKKNAYRWADRLVSSVLEPTSPRPVHNRSSIQLKFIHNVLDSLVSLDEEGPPDVSLSTSPQYLACGQLLIHIHLYYDELFRTGSIIEAYQFYQMLRQPCGIPGPPRSTPCSPLSALQEDLDQLSFARATCPRGVRGRIFEDVLPPEPSVSFSSIVDFSSWINPTNKLSELDAIVLRGKVRSRTGQWYWLLRQVLEAFLELPAAEPSVWTYPDFVAMGQKILDQCMVLEALVQTGDTELAMAINELTIRKRCPPVVQYAHRMRSPKGDRKLMHYYQAQTLTGNMSSRSVDYWGAWLLAQFGSPDVDDVETVPSTRQSSVSDLEPSSPIAEAQSVPSQGRCRLKPVDRDRQEADPVPLYDIRRSNGSSEAQDIIQRTGASATPPLGKGNIRTSIHWSRRYMTEECPASNTEEHGYGVLGLEGDSLRNAKPRRWLPYLVEDFYNLNYHMFIDFSEWISPRRSFTIQGDLAPITPNIINLEKLEVLEPELTPLYNLIRHEHCFDALTIPDAKTSVKDRVRLTSQQISDATDWRVLEELPCQPEVGVPVGMFTVKKKPPSTKLRLIVDGRPWNQTQQRPAPMPIPRLRDTIRELQRMNFAVQYDGVSFFYQFPLRHSRCFFRRRGKWYRIARMPMGWSWAPLIAQSTANAILAETKRRFLRHCPNADTYTAAWIDNFVLAAKTEEELRKLEQEFLQVAREVSLELKKEEAVDPRHTTFAGIEHDLCLHQYRPLASSHSVQEVVTVRDVMRNCGACIWQLYSRGRNLCFYEDLLNTVGRVCSPAMRGECGWDAPVARYLSKSDPSTLQQLLVHAQNTDWDQVTPNRTLCSKKTWFDASSNAWAFTTDLRVGGQGLFMRPEQLHIFIKEAIAFLAAVRCEVASFKGRRRIFYTDNMPLAKAFKKGHSSSQHCNKILRQIFTILLEHDAEIELIWIPTDTNLSDKYTRGVHLSMPKKFRRLVEKEPLIDAHTSFEPSTRGI